MSELDPKAMNAAFAAADEASPTGKAYSPGITAAITAYLAASQEPAPVAWQTRQRRSDGTWTPWWGIPEDSAAALSSQNRTDIEVRPLFAAPVPPVVGEDARYDSAALEAARKITTMLQRGGDDHLKAKIQVAIIDAMRAALASSVAKPCGVDDEMVLAYKRAFQDRIAACLMSAEGMDGARTLNTDATRAGLEAALSHPAQGWREPEGRLPRLTDKMIRAACKAHFGTENMDGVSLTADDIDWTFRDAFKRMWSGVRAALASSVAKPYGVTEGSDLIERAVQASIDAGLAVNGEQGVASARHAARFILSAIEGGRS